jgi:Fe-S oxidoreductase
VLRAAEKCNGVGECRKSHLMGGTMCPSYMATRNEQDTTRARANLLREVLTHPATANPWDSAEVAGVMDLCLSCKGCKSECPSNVDVARLKAEWQQHWHDAHGVPFRSRLVANFAPLMRWAALAPRLYNWAVTQWVTSALIKRLAGFAPGAACRRCTAPRSPRGMREHAGGRWVAGCSRPAAARAPLHAFLPPRPRPSLLRRVHQLQRHPRRHQGRPAAQPARLRGRHPAHVESGRAHLSKGLVRDAQRLAIRNVELLKDVITAGAPLIGLEPSAILGFRDEYPDLVPAPLKRGRPRPREERAAHRRVHRPRGRRRPHHVAPSFTPRAQAIKLHGHCHQKALSSLAPDRADARAARRPPVSLIPSGCCGMAGSFGYEAEHFALSQQIGELVLFPAVRAAAADTLIAAPGTSCRHQIKDGTGRVALHPVEILHAALV